MSESAHIGYARNSRVVRFIMSSKRADVLSWDQTFMSIAEVIAKRSKDPRTQVGACVVSDTNHVLSLGYNGTPVGFDDDDFPWDAEPDDPLNTKYPYVVHAEQNVILNFRGITKDLRNSTIYVTHYPCRECAKSIVQSGIRNVVYLNGGRHFDEASRIIFSRVGVSVREYAM